LVFASNVCKECYNGKTVNNIFSLQNIDALKSKQAEIGVDFKPLRKFQKNSCEMKNSTKK